MGFVYFVILLFVLLIAYYVWLIMNSNKPKFSDFDELKEETTLYELSSPIVVTDELIGYQIRNSPTSTAKTENRTNSENSSSSTSSPNGLQVKTSSPETKDTTIQEPMGVEFLSLSSLVDYGKTFHAGTQTFATIAIF